MNSSAETSRYCEASRRDVVINSPPIYRWVGAQNKSLVPKGRLMSQDYISYESPDQIETRRDHSGRDLENNNQPCLRHFPSNWGQRPTSELVGYSPDVPPGQKTTSKTNTENKIQNNI